MTIVAGIYATRVQLEDRTEVWFTAQERELQAHADLKSVFGGDETVVIGVLAEDVLAPPVLHQIDRWVHLIERLPGVAAVRALTNSTFVQAVPEGVELQVLSDALPKTRADCARLDERLRSAPELEGLVNVDRTGAQILVYLAHTHATVPMKIDFADRLERALEVPEGMMVHLVGTPLLDRAFYRATAHDAQVLGGLSFLCVALVMMWLLRSWQASVLILATVGLAVVWSFGVMGLLGLKLNLMSSALGSVVLAIGVADGVHVWVEYARQRPRFGTGRSAAIETVRVLALPCGVTSLTTACALFSLVLADLQPLRDFGLLSGFGVLFAYALSFTLLPLLLMRFGPSGSDSRTFRWPGTLAAFTARYRVPIAGAASLLVLGAAALIPGLRTGNNMIENLPASSTLYQDALALDAALGVGGTLEFLVSTEVGGVQEPDLLGRLQTLERALRRDRRVTTVHSPLSLVRPLGVGMGLVDAAAPVPTDANAVAQLFMLAEQSEDFDRWVGGDYQWARLSAGVRVFSEDAMTEWLGEIEALARSLSRPGAEIVLTGFMPLTYRSQTYLVESQGRTMGWAFVLIAFFLALILRSLKIGLVAMIPNVAPILVATAALVLFDFPMSAATVMTASIALGIVVDDTVHLLVAYARSRQSGENALASVRVALEQVARPVMVTSLTLIAGFLPLVFAHTVPNRVFGVMTCAIIVLAALFDLVVVPAVLSLRVRSPGRLQGTARND